MKDLSEITVRRCRDSRVEIVSGDYKAKMDLALFNTSEKQSEEIEKATNDFIGMIANILAE